MGWPRSASPAPPPARPRTFIAEGKEPIDPIRIMKGMFLFSQEAGLREVSYDFVPYSYGPCSFDIYGDLDKLTANAMIARLSGVSRWPLYEVTTKGNRALQSLPTNARVHSEIQRLREYVNKRGFQQLLREIYKKYQRYAVNNLFNS